MSSALVAAHRPHRPDTATTPPRQQRSEAVAALKISGSVGLAMIPIGIAFGMLVVHSGLVWWWPPSSHR
jgi:predicted branched-subunit amino acid permease